MVLIGGWGIQMRARTARWVPRCAAAGSVALTGGGLVLAYVDRHLVPASLTNWTVSNISSQVVNMAVPVTGFVLAARRPQNPLGWLFLAAGVALGLSGFSNPYALHALVAERGSWPAGRVFGWLSNWIWMIAVAVLAFLFLLFPTGRAGRSLCGERRQHRVGAPVHLVRPGEPGRAGRVPPCDE
jgi:hypothetical protein